MCPSKHHQLGKRFNEQTIKSVIKHVIISSMWVHNTEMDTCDYIHPGWNFTALSITHLHPALVNFIKIELCSRYGAHKPNAGFLPPFAICVIECYIVSADIALLYICLITIHVSYHTWYCREVCDFNPVCSRGYTASFIGWFESAVTDWDGFFCSVFIVCAAQIVCHMFYFILFNFNLLMLWQWNNISYMYVWHRWQIKNNNNGFFSFWTTRLGFMKLSSSGSANAQLSRCFHLWAFFLNIGLNLLPSESFMSCLYSLLA